RVACARRGVRGRRGHLRLVTEQPADGDTGGGREAEQLIGGESAASGQGLGQFLLMDADRLRDTELGQAGTGDGFLGSDRSRTGRAVGAHGANLPETRIDSQTFMTESQNLRLSVLLHKGRLCR